MRLPEDQRLPRDPETLNREVDALIRISDIEAIYRYREQLENKWWEPAIVAMLFVSGLGFILTIYKLIPAGDSLLFWFIFGWFVLFVLTLIATIEFLLLKIAALRKLHEIHTRILDDLMKQARTGHREREKAESGTDAGPPPAGGA